MVAFFFLKREEELKQAYKALKNKDIKIDFHFKS
jgi:hypothetical protein